VPNQYRETQKAGKAAGFLFTGDAGKPVDEALLFAPTTYNYTGGIHTGESPGPQFCYVQLELCCTYAANVALGVVL